MVAVRVMQAPVHQIIDMVAVRHGLVAAVRAVTVSGIVAGGVILGIAAIRIDVTHRDRVLICPAALAVFKAAVIEIIDMAFMLDGEVAAARAVHMRFLGGWHCHILSPQRHSTYLMGEGDRGENAASGSLNKESFHGTKRRVARSKRLTTPAMLSRA
jgi:hypothetical protein